MTTIGEKCFEEFCVRRGVKFARIPVESIPSPDYEVWNGARRFVVEIKTLEPNKEEAKINNRRACGEIVVGDSMPGERLRKEIRSANRQFKNQRVVNGDPTLLVVFNDTGCTIHTDLYSVMVAMQGLDVIDVSVPCDSALRPTFGPWRSGPRRAMRSDANTSTSAVAVLHYLQSDDIQLLVFHNRCASVPFDPEVFRMSEIRQFKLPEGVASSLEEQWLEI